MLDSRRRFFYLLAGTAGSAVVLPRLLFAQAPVVQGPKNPLPEAPVFKRDTKRLLQEDQKEIKKNVSRLYELVSELKQEVEKTDGTTILSLGLLRKTEEIEKLARQIRSRAKGE